MQVYCTLLCVGLYSIIFFVSCGLTEHLTEQNYELPFWMHALLILR